MKRLTMVDGIGQNELVACFECHTPGENNENCGMCEKFNDMINKLSAYENVAFLQRKFAMQYSPPAK